MRGLEVALKLTVLSSCLRVTAHDRPPLPKETLGVVTIVGVRGVRRGSSRHRGRRLTGPRRKWPEAVTEDEPADALMDDSRYGWERSVLPHAVEPLANRDLFL